MATYNNKDSKKFTTSKAKSSQVVFTSELFNKFLQSRPSGISSRTVEAYHYTLGRFVGYPLTPEGINSYINSLSCRNGKLKFYSCLRALSRWLYHNGYIAENIIDKVAKPKTQGKLLSAIGKEQLDVLLEHCHCERDKALLNLLWYSGMRLSEATNVKASDFN